MRSCSRRSASPWPQLQLAVWRGALVLGEGVRLPRVQQQRCVLAQGVRLLPWPQLQLAVWRGALALGEGVRLPHVQQRRCVLAQGVRLLPWPQLQLALLLTDLLMASSLCLCSLFWAWRRGVDRHRRVAFAMPHVEDHRLIRVLQLLRGFFLSLVFGEDGFSKPEWNGDSHLC